MLYNILLAPDLRDRLFSIIMLMNLGHTFLFHIEKCTHSAQTKHAFLVKTKEKSRQKKKKVSLELLHQRIGQISTGSLLDGGTVNVWQ